jgi:hypothetical protein
MPAFENIHFEVSRGLLAPGLHDIRRRAAVALPGEGMDGTLKRWLRMVVIPFAHPHVCTQWRKNDLQQLRKLPGALWGVVVVTHLFKKTIERKMCKGWAYRRILRSPPGRDKELFW